MNRSGKKPRITRHVAAVLALLAPLSPLATPAVGVRPAAAQPSERDAVLERSRTQRANQYKMFQQNIESMQALPAKKLGDVLRLKMDGRHLVVVSPLTTDEHINTSYRVKSDFFKGPTYVQVSNMGMIRMGLGAGGLVQARMFTLVSYELPNLDELDNLSVQSYPGYLQFNRQSQIGAGGSRTIRLLQTRPADAQGGQPAGPGAAQGLVQLFVNESGDAVPAGGLPRNINLHAPDFQTLVREHGREADEFVRPLLRQIGQESVLAPDDQVAWQVLSDRWQPDPKLAGRVRELLPALNDADFHARDKALVEIQRMGKDGAAVLLHLDRAGLTPEQNLAIDRTLAPFAQLSAKEAARLRDDRDFLLDCLYGNDRELRAAALDRLKQLTDKDVSFDLDASESDRWNAVSTLRRQLAAKGPSATTGPTTAPAKP